MNAIQKFIVTDSNWDSGRGGHMVTGIVLHTMVGNTSGSQARFNDPASQVSVHYGISLDGSIHQWVEEADTAYQAGNYTINQTTIGIEHSDNSNPNDSVRTQAEYDSSSDLVADICKRYQIPCDTDHIFLHKDVIDTSVYPGGTACPDGLDTNKIISMAAAKLQGDSMYPNANDLQTITNQCGWQKDPDGKTNPNAIAFWTTGTSNPDWGNPHLILVKLALELYYQGRKEGEALATDNGAQGKLDQIKQIVG